MASSSSTVRAVLAFSRNSLGSGSRYPVAQRSRKVSAVVLRPPAVLASFQGRQHRRYASTTAEPASASDPTLDRALDLIESGTHALEDGDLDAARVCYKDSLDVKETSGGWFNLGVCEYHLKNQAGAVEAWEKSIAFSPSADAYTNLASAYILFKPPQPGLAIKQLTAALELAPDDPEVSIPHPVTNALWREPTFLEIAFNLAAVLESTDNLETALKLYAKAQQGGIERAAQNIRSVSAKILTQRGIQAEARSE